MGLFKWLLIIAVVIFLVYIFFPDTYYLGKEKLFGLKDTLLDSKVDDAPYINNFSLSEEKDKLSDYILNNNVSDEVDVGFDESDPCTWTYQAKPRGVDKCTDTFADPDFVCLENYPVIYSGVIDLVNKDSYPLLKCCVPTGMCAWR